MMWLAGVLGLIAVGGLSLSGEDEDLADMEADMEPEADGDADLSNSSGDTPDLIQALDVSRSFADNSVAGDTSEDSDDAAIQILSGTDDDDAISGGLGDDQINGYDGNDDILGGAGTDTLFGSGGDDTLRGGAGDDILHADEGNDRLFGNSGDDTLFGHSGDDVLSGGSGDDSAQGGTGADRLSGGAGDDALLGGLDDDWLSGGSGQDTLFGGWGNDIVLGAEELDGLAAESDFLNGGGGDDTIVAGAGDIVTAGDGADQIVLGDWSLTGETAELMDFDRGEDQLVLVWNSATPPDIEITADADVDGLSHIFVDGSEIASVRGSTPLPGDIRIIDTSQSAALGLTG